MTDKIIPPGSNRFPQVYTKIRRPLGLFGQITVVERSPILELKSNYGISNLRDITEVTGSGSVTNDNTEYRVRTGTTTGSTAVLKSAEKGRYLPGNIGEIGLGIRIPNNSLTGTQDMKWGYFDDNSGFGFGQDATGVYIFIRRTGVDTKTYQENWNLDVLDGTGDSEETLDITNGNIFQMNYAWYGYGSIQFEIITNNGNRDRIQSLNFVHVFNPDGETSIDNPNLPLTIEVDNGNTTDDLSVYVGGRQYSVLGKYIPNRRVNSDYRLSQGNIGTTFVPTVSFRRKTGIFDSVSIKIEGIETIPDANMLYQIRVNPTLTGASFGNLSDTTASETALESDTSATAISGGEVLYEGLLESARTQAGGFGTRLITPLDIPENQIISLCVRRVTGTQGNISTVFRMKEEW